MICRLIMITIAASVLSLSAAAQEPAFPRLVPAADSIQKPWDPNSPHIILPGQRTKITAPALVSHALLGKVYTIKPDTIVLITDRFYPGEPDAWKISLKSIRKYQIPEGYRDRAITGVMLGSCAGFILSTAFALVDNDRRASDRAFPYPATITGGGIIGGLAGALTKSERWRTVPNEWLKLGLPLPEEPVPLHTVTVGERVRILAQGFDKDGVTGFITDLNADTITVLDEPFFLRKSQHRRISVDQITLYRVSVGKRSNALAGAAVGLWVGVFLGSTKGNFDREGNLEEVSTTSMIGFGAAGMAVGALIGVGIKSDVWKTVPVDRLRLP